MSTAVAPARRPRPRAVLGAVAWEPHAELDLAEWVEHGRRLGGAGRSCGWWIGDWLRYGNERFGERYRRASNATGYDIQTLMNMVYVASHIDVSRRRETLSWSHHAELAALPVEEQEKWLMRAEEHKWSVRDMRTEIRNARHAQGAEGSKGFAESSASTPIATRSQAGAAAAPVVGRSATDSAGSDTHAHPDSTSGPTSAPTYTTEPIVCPRCGYAISA